MDKATKYILVKDHIQEMKETNPEIELNEEVLLTEFIMAAIGIISILGLIGLLALSSIIDAVAKEVDEGYKVCSKKYKTNTDQYKRCKALVKIEAYDKTSRLLTQKANKDCPKSKDPKKCKEKVKVALSKLKFKKEEQIRVVKKYEARAKY